MNIGRTKGRKKYMDNEEIEKIREAQKVLDWKENFIHDKLNILLTNLEHY
jgi:hypothetical protein